MDLITHQNNYESKNYTSDKSTNHVPFDATIAQAIAKAKAIIVKQKNNEKCKNYQRKSPSYSLQNL